ncbi:MAG: type II toxin-antitoxin system RelE/ParE family toxin [Verrucomicrobia bacterium]|nr:type II toxin-antitoxin system RelE/ParE family toxin [Verrucomicrobiota bacterium]
MKIEFLPEAREEFFEASVYYETKEKGLGIRFRDEVAHVLEHVSSDPYLWRERDNGYRRVNCPVFPYYIAYFIRENSVIIAAVAHGHREPEYWKKRMK